jgi:hypothetical protein
MRGVVESQPCSIQFDCERSVAGVVARETVVVCNARGATYQASIEWSTTETEAAYAVERICSVSALAEAATQDGQELEHEQLRHYECAGLRDQFT